MSVQAFFSSSALHQMYSWMSGWSTFRMTILAARRVFPPDLMTPAKASYPFMKETGPEAVPPPLSRSFEERNGEKLVPDPEPHLNSIPSVLASSRIESMRSRTELMKQAEHCGFSSMPTLNQTGELNEAIWWRTMCVSSASKASASAGVSKTPCSRPQRAIDPTTRVTSCLTERSRSGVPTGPLKYFEATTLVAICDQKAGTSTPCCSKITSPFSLASAAVRSSQATASNGWTWGWVNRRAIVTPRPSVRPGRGMEVAAEVPPAAVAPPAAVEAALSAPPGVEPVRLDSPSGPPGDPAARAAAVSTGSPPASSPPAPRSGRESPEAFSPASSASPRPVPGSSPAPVVRPLRLESLRAMTNLHCRQLQGRACRDPFFRRRLPRSSPWRLTSSALPPAPVIRFQSTTTGSGRMARGY